MGILSYSYDGSLLTTTTWTGTVAGSVSRDYDNNFRITSQSVNGGNTISFGYDNDSLLTSTGSLLVTRHPSHGLITGSSLGMVTDSRSYNPFGELSAYTASANSAPVLDVQYTRDKLGRITQKGETIGGTTATFDYTYGLAGRLTEVKKNAAVLATYGYDSNGNRLTKTTSSGTVNGTYDAQDRLTQYGTTTYGKIEKVSGTFFLTGRGEGAMIRRDGTPVTGRRGRRDLSCAQPGEWAPAAVRESGRL